MQKEDIKIDYIGLNKLAKRFLNHDIAKGLTIKEIEMVLIGYAKDYGGCLNCIYASPCKSWLVRKCIYGFNQKNCKVRKPIIKKEVKTIPEDLL